MGEVFFDVYFSVLLGFVELLMILSAISSWLRFLGNQEIMKLHWKLLVQCFEVYYFKIIFTMCVHRRVM